MPESDPKVVVVADVPAGFEPLHVGGAYFHQRMAYASCDLKVGARHVLRSSGVFAFVDRPWPPAASSSETPPLQDG